MKLKIVSVCTLLLLTVATNSQADEMHVCTHGQKERVISLVYPKPGKIVPCQVWYTDDDVTEILWEAKNKIGYCEQKVEEFVQKQKDWGWRCPDQQFAILDVDSIPEEKLNSYKISSSFVESISVLTPFRSMVIDYYYSTGEFPSMLDHIGMRASDMKDSKHVSDIGMGDNGELFIKGNEAIGLDTVVMFKPTATLGGSMIEWQCVTNLKNKNIDYCDYEPELMFK